jgi:hypothetical protein
MNQVFIPRSVERVGEEGRSVRKHVRNVAALVLGGATGGALFSLAIAELGRALREIDPTPGSQVVLLAILGISIFVIAVQLSGRIQPLPEPRRQVPRRWLGWKCRWLTAYWFGFVLGAGALTHLRQASMYALALMVAISPNVYVAVCVGAAYGANRGATVFYTWIMRHFGSSASPGLGRTAPAVLAVAATALPVWALAQLVA